MNFRVYLAAIVSLLLTLFAWYSVKSSIDLNDSNRFAAAHADIRENISNQMEAYVNTLVQMRSMFGVTPVVTRKAFHEYVESLQLLSHYPGIQGVAYSMRVRPSELKTHLSAVRKEGFPDYRIWPAGERAEYSSVVFIEPFNQRNQRAFGFDMMSDSVRRAAMEKARDEGIAAASGPVTLVQETTESKQTGFVIYVPVYVKDAQVRTVEQRRSALQGFVSSPFRTEDLFQGIFRLASRPSHVGFEVFEGKELKPEALLFSTHEAELLTERTLSGRPRLISDLPLKVAGRVWTVRAKSLPGFRVPWTRHAATAVLLTGLLVTFLILYSMRAVDKELGSRHELQESQARLKTEKEVLQTVNHLGQSIASELNLQKLVQSVTDAATKVCGAQFGAFFYNVTDEAGATLTLYTISGVPIEHSSRFPLPLDTQGLAPAFKSNEVIRSDDITQDPRYGKNLPHHGMPEGHLPVVSYLAVPVISRTGVVLGGLFFGHAQKAVFTEREEQVVVGLAAQAAVGIDNARLFQEAQEAVRIRDEFLSIASHELKTPITSLKMQIQLTQRSLKAGPSGTELSMPSPERLDKAMEIFTRQVNRLSGLVENLLDVSKIGAGKIEYSREEVDLVELTQNVIEQLSDSLALARCPLTLTAPAPVVIECDRFRIEQVITNLLTNAMKYGAGKPIEISILSRVDSAKGRMAQLSFKDGGIGIDKSKQGTIFGRFERAISHSNISGLGLGLYISKQIVDAHHGVIEIESDLGQGSLFTVQLPAEPVEIAPVLS
ncbi:MAG: CHASE domain-containing protein [Methylotenera sp.]|nr:CHASE domain-containing protein [Oligoflexia bacterium]